MQRPISYRNLPQLFLKAREQMLSHFRPILKHYGLTEQQWRILRVLGEEEQLEQREICDHCQILSPSLAGVLARMEELGVITRNRVPQDQRRVIVQLNAEGTRLVSEISPLIEAQYHKVEKSLGRELVDELYTVLDKVISDPHPPVEHISLPKRANKRNQAKQVLRQKKK